MLAADIERENPQLVEQAGRIDVTGILADVLAEKTHSAMIYANEAMETMYHRWFKIPNEIIGELVKSFLQDTKEKTIRVLEVGGGYGTGTTHVLPHLPVAQTSYVFTDISGFFLQKAREKFERGLESCLKPGWKIQQSSRPMCQRKKNPTQKRSLKMIR